MRKSTLIRIVGTIVAMATFLAIAHEHRSYWFTAVVGGGIAAAISMGATVLANRQHSD